VKSHYQETTSERCVYGNHQFLQVFSVPSFLLHASYFCKPICVHMSMLAH
jgi:hypothetical protein